LFNEDYMKGKTLKYIILLATITVAGTISMQFFFLKKSYSYSENQFREIVDVALKEVAWQIMAANGNIAGFDSITQVNIIAKDCYLIGMNSRIDHDLLRFHLNEELRKHQVYTDFEFAVYDRVTGNVEEKTLITVKGEEKISDYCFPEGLETGLYYFSVHFPDLAPYFHSQLSIWYFFTGLMLVIILFFGYTLFVIIRQRQLSQIQKNFINNLTHELKTPISSIALSAKVIREGNIIHDPDRLFQYARIIQEQNNRLSQNVEKVLNMASLEKNKLSLNKEKIELIELLNEVIESFRQSETGQKADVEMHFDQDSYVITADRFHLTNLLMNIIENGSKYCESQPRIFIDVHRQNNELSLEIADNGVGIPPEYKKKIFKQFFRIPTGNVHDVKGFGLGLNYVLKIVRAHKWDIKVFDNPQGGSIFAILISQKNE